MRRLITAAACLCIVFAKAQSGNISGKITDSSGKKNLALTTITIFNAKDTSIITYRLSNELGEFKIPGLPFNIPLRLMATYSGYEAFRKDFVVTATEPAVNFGTIKMTGTSKQLDEVIVFSERPPVVIKRDTIEFNASAFKTLPNALLEDLLKKLPGVYVDEDGNIKVNGQIVNRLLVDGKSFFGDNPLMATRNLPSNLIDKVQVVDDKDQMALNNDGDMSKIGKVINITLKKGIKKAVFGRLFAGGGTEDRYDVGGILNMFRDTFQVSVLGFANNVNRSSFSFKDITQMGGFSRSGWGNINGSGNGSGQQGVALDGFSFGGTGNGLNTASGAGFNINHSPTKNLNFFLNYLFGKTHNDLEQVSNTQRFFGDTIINSHTTTTSGANAHTQNIGIGGSWRPDSLTNTTFRFTYAYVGNNAETPSAIIINNNKLGALSNGNGTLYTNGRRDAYTHYITFTHRFLKKGRNLSVYNSFSHAANPVSNLTESINSFLTPVSSNIIFQQLRSTDAPTTNTSLTANYSDQLSPTVTFRFNENLQYTKNVQDVLTYGKRISSNAYDSLNVSLSNNLDREETKWSNNAALGFKIKSVNLTVGATWLQQWINNGFKLAAQNNHFYYSNLLLNINVNWKKFSASFSQDIIAPGIGYLLPVPDNSNPFFITYGNPNLKPWQRNSLSFNGNIFQVKTNTNFYFSLQSSLSDNAIIQSVSLNSNGVQTNRPVNVSGVLSNFLDIGFNRQFKNKQNVSLTVNIGPTFNLSRTPIIFNNEESRVTNLNLGAGAGVTLNWKDIVEFNPNYSIGSNKSYYTSKSFSDRDIMQQSFRGEFILRLPKKMVWETNMIYRKISEVSPGLPATSVYWNAAVTFLMFQQDKGQLRFGVYDILSSNTNVGCYFSGNAIIDTKVNVLSRYFLLTYTYNIRTFGNQSSKVGGQQSLFRM
ncbi:MAG: TonB-dependent receptor [Sediminibacterium sp.]|nr:TonB-dependent receptor [Sediminibacterium sp.]